METEAIDSAGLNKAKETPTMTRDQYELRLVNIETIYSIAFESAKTMDVFDSTAKDMAKQRRMNMMVETMICQLEEETNVTIAVDRIEQGCKIPFPPRINRRLTLVNWDNHR